MKDKRYGVKGKTIYDTILGRLNIDFENESNAQLCCDLLNSKEQETKAVIVKLDSIIKWYEEYYGETILDTRMGWNK